MEFTQAQKKQITNLMKTLDLSRDEAIELMLEDAEVDLMTNKEVQSDLTKEQKEAINKTTKDRSGKYEKSAEVLAREEQARQDKATALEKLMSAVEVVEVVKEGQEFIFKDKDIKYRCKITKVRKQS